VGEDPAKIEVHLHRNFPKLFGDLRGPKDPLRRVPVGEELADPSPIAVVMGYDVEDDVRHGRFTHRLSRRGYGRRWTFPLRSAAGPGVVNIARLR
jgi:hypothetical protein